MLRQPEAYAEVFARACTVANAYLACEHTAERFAARWRAATLSRSVDSTVASRVPKLVP
jgi:hypothetical protein